MGSFRRSASTRPGITRPPVNSTCMASTNAVLRDLGGREPGIHFHTARQAQKSVDLARRVAHLQRDGIVDPVAHLVAQQGAVGDGRRKRKGGGIQLRHLEMKVHRIDIVRHHGGQIVTFARGVGAREIDAELVAHHESHDGLRDLAARAHADAHGDALRRLQKVHGVALRIQHGDSQHFRAAVAIAVVDVWNALDDFRSAHARACARTLRRAFQHQVRRVLFHHGRQILSHHPVRFADLPKAALLQPQGAVADGIYIGDGVGNEQNRDAPRAQFVHLAHAALPEVDVAHRQGFVHQQDLRVHVDGYSKREPDDHTARIGLHRLVDELADFGKVLDILVALVDLPGAQAQDGSVQIDVIVAGEFGMKFEGEPMPDGWVWATEVRTTTPLLAPVGPDTFNVFDYLVDEVNRTAVTPVPDTALTTALRYADAADAMRVGTIARAHGRYEIALRAYSHAREVRTSALGREHPDTLTSWGNLAAVLRTLGRLEEAEAEHRAVLEARIRVLGPEHPSTLACRTNLGLVLHDLGRLEEAEVEHRAVLEARIRVLGPEHPATLTNRNNLAFVLHDLGRLTEAEAEHCAVLAAYTRILGQEQPSTSSKPVNVAAVLRALGSLEDAEAEHRAILDTSTRVFGPDHPDAVTSRGSPTLVLHSVERLGEAESMHRDVYQGFTRVLGPDHPSTLTSRNYLAFILHAASRDEEAESECRAVVDGFARVLGPDHPSTLASRSHLAVVLHAAGRVGEAESEHRAVVDGFARVLGPDHPSTLTSRNYLAFILHAASRDEEAESECRAVVDGFARVLGPDHPSTLTSRSNLAAVLCSLGRPSEAEGEHRAAVEGFTSLRGAAHPATLTSRSNLADALYALGRLGEAEAEHRTVVDGFVRLLGPAHPRSLRAKQILQAFENMAR